MLEGLLQQHRTQDLVRPEGQDSADVRSDEFEQKTPKHAGLPSAPKLRESPQASKGPFEWSEGLPCSDGNDSAGDEAQVHDGMAAFGNNSRGSGYLGQ
jgi:hypothetical protein